MDVVNLAKSDAYYEAKDRLDRAERHLSDEIKYDRPEWKIKDARKDVESAKRILAQAERDG